MKKSLTSGNIFTILMEFSIPYFFACFLQNFYGLADLFIAGAFNGADTISAVSSGSQIMHMLTVIVTGLVMGSTVSISQCIGANDTKKTSKVIGNTISIFLIVALILVSVLLFFVDGIIGLISTPIEAVAKTKDYLIVCFIGLPFIIAYNVISSIFRGLGDTKTPMYFVVIAGIINIALDYVFIGLLHLDAKGAALATVISQGISVILALVTLKKIKFGIAIKKSDLIIDQKTSFSILRIGLPIALQDGFIQVTFVVITAIANMRGLTIAASVGIVEKLICFFFLVPSAMLSSVSAIAAQNAGANLHNRAKQVLYYGFVVCTVYGVILTIICQFFAEQFVGLFSHTDPEVLIFGGQYLKAYVYDCIFAGIHFCFSGYFCAYNKAMYSFLHNIITIITIRIPGAYLASIYFPNNLYPMGWAAPLGSVLSSIICVGLYANMQKKLPNNLS